MKVEHLGLLLHQSNKRFKAFLDRELRKLKLSSVELAVIMDLFHQKTVGSEQSRTASILASRLDIDLKKFEEILFKMESNDWIVRVPGQVDRRSLDIFLSSKALSIIDYLGDRYTYVDDKAYKDFSQEEIEAVEGYLRRIAENLI